MTKDEALKMAIEAMCDFDYDKRLEAIQACKEALEQPAQEPVAIVYSMQDGYIGQMVVKDIPHKTKLYTHPAPLWQRLSFDEIHSIIKELSGYDTDADNYDVAVFVEQVLRNKNGS